MSRARRPERCGRRSPAPRARAAGWAWLTASSLALSGFAMMSTPAASAAVQRSHGPKPASTTTTVAPVMPLPMPPPPAQEDTCANGAWPSDVEGRPLSLALANGAYLWHDPDGGWALRVTHRGLKAKVVFSGSLTSLSGQLTEVTATGQGPTDIVFETAGKHTVFFRFAQFGLVDGLNFATWCARGFSVTIRQGGGLAPARTVHLGSFGVSPLSNPFRVARASRHGSTSTTSTSTPTSTP